MPGSLRALLLIAMVGCAACEMTSEECTKQLSELKDLCPPGSRVSFAAMGSDNASGNVKAGETEKSGSGEYRSEGACKVLCEPRPPCPCGIKTESRDSYECFPLSECAAGCGDGVCDDDEDVDHCGRDCAPEMSDGEDSDSAGSGGKSGSSSDGSDAGMSEDGETGGSSDGGSASSDPGAGKSCIQLVRGRYVVRTDGKLLAENRDKSMETVIGDGDGHPLTDVTDVAGGVYHGCALRMDGTVWCWREQTTRSNVAGQLGNGSTDEDAEAKLYRASQVLVAPDEPLENVKELVRSGGDVSATCVLTEDEKMWCWGDLANLVNDGKPLASAYAQAITTDGIAELSGVQQASFASTMACAVVKEDPSNALYCWGVNDYGNLGNGDNVRQQFPTKVTTLTSPSFVSVMPYGYALSGGGTACAIDGEELRCWGANGAGEAANGTTANANMPTPVVLMNGTTPLPPPVELIGNGGTFCARLENKTLWCWGALYGAYPTKYGVTNVAGLGGVLPLASNSHYPLFYTSDGLYHWGMEWARSPKCGAL